VRRSLVGLVLVLAGAMSCGSQVNTLGSHHPARPVGCAVEIVPGAPAWPVVDVALARVKCIETGPSDCLAGLRAQACAAGGDTVYGLAQSTEQHITSMTARLALRSPPGAPTPGSTAGEAHAAACTPICSPGFDCQGGRCIPLCNPACGPSEICNMQRTCEPAPSPASPDASAAVPAA
jgi:hypothetical protein